MLEEVSDPLSITNIGLSTRNRFDVLRIDDQHLKITFRAGLNAGFQYTPVDSIAT
jgi:hypothetical protein